MITHETTAINAPIFEEFGVYSKNPSVLQKRYRLSRGVRLLDPALAALKGYRPVPESAAGIVVPRIDDVSAFISAEPTDEDLAAITATPNTERVIKIIRLQGDIAKGLIAQCIKASGMPERPGENDIHDELIGGIRGVARSMRIDQPGLLSVSLSSLYPKKYVGDHIDTWDNVDTSFLIANMGPGDRWHRVIPALNRIALGGTSIAAQSDYIIANNLEHDVPVHWFKLEPGEAAINLPVAWATHDGSTLGNKAHSQAALCVMEPVQPEMVPYPSVV